MKINNLFVGYIYNVLSQEDGAIVIREGLPPTGPYILRQEADDVFVNLDNGKPYTTKDVFGLDKVDKKTLKPLSAYYGILSIKKTAYKDSMDVHSKVKYLKKIRRIK